MVQRLDFLVIGAQKCATSWLYYCLKEHPELKLPARKFEAEYLGGDLYETRGPEWYFSLFEGAREHQKVGAVSIEYLFDARAPKVIHRYAPNVKLVVSLRDPIDRAISGYFWDLRRGLIPDLSLEETLNIALDGNSSTKDPQARQHYEELISRGFYDLQLERYLEYFSVTQFLFVLYEDIKVQPLSVIQRIYRFIGVDDSFEPLSLKMKPKHTTYLRPLIYLERLTARSAFDKVMELTNMVLYRLGLYVEKPQLSHDLSQRLEAVYKPHIDWTQKIVAQAPEEQQPFSRPLGDTWLRTRK